MPRKKQAATSEGNDDRRPVSLKELARYVKLSPTALSLVLNDSPAAASIPQETKDRILAAAKELNYRPNFLARSLRSRRTYTVGVLVPELSEGYSAQVLSGIEDYLIREGYVYLVTSHRHKPKLLSQSLRLLHERRVEGFIGVDTPMQEAYGLPIVAVSGTGERPGLTRVVLNHDTAADLGLGHLAGLGHRNIAFIRGQEFTSDAEVRWESIRTAVQRMCLEVDPALVVQLDTDTPSPETGYVAAKRLLQSGRGFTAVFAFNDISAFGAIRAFREAGKRVPEDVSVVGFDDVNSAAYHIPALTTIRQPLQRMGALAAEALVKRIANPGGEIPERVMVEPELVVRESTCVVRDQ